MITADELEAWDRERVEHARAEEIRASELHAAQLRDIEDLINYRAESRRLAREEIDIRREEVRALKQIALAVRGGAISKLDEEIDCMRPVGSDVERHLYPELDQRAKKDEYARMRGGGGA